MISRQVATCRRKTSTITFEAASCSSSTPHLNARTVFLARLFGLYCIIMAAAMLSRPEAFVTTVNALVADAPLVLIASVFTLFGGLALVLLHNYWSGGALSVIVTLLGWLTFTINSGLKPAGGGSIPGKSHPESVGFTRNECRRKSSHIYKCRATGHRLARGIDLTITTFHHAIHIQRRLRRCRTDPHIPLPRGVQ